MDKPTFIQFLIEAKYDDPNDLWFRRFIQESGISTVKSAQQLFKNFKKPLQALLHGMFTEIRALYEVHLDMAEEYNEDLDPNDPEDQMLHVNWDVVEDLWYGWDLNEIPVYRALQNKIPPETFDVLIELMRTFVGETAKEYHGEIIREAEYAGQHPVIKWLYDTIDSLTTKLNQQLMHTTEINDEDYEDYEDATFIKRKQVSGVRRALVDELGEPSLTLNHEQFWRIERKEQPWFVVLRRSPAYVSVSWIS